MKVDKDRCRNCGESIWMNDQKRWVHLLAWDAAKCGLAEPCSGVAVILREHNRDTE